jgi:hypothetical protein
MVMTPHRRPGGVILHERTGDPKRPSLPHFCAATFKDDRRPTTDLTTRQTAHPKAANFDRGTGSDPSRAHAREGQVSPFS